MNFNRISVRIGVIALLTSICLSMVFVGINVFPRLKAEQASIYAETIGVIGVYQPLQPLTELDSILEQISLHLDHLNGPNYLLGAAIYDSTGRPLVEFDGRIVMASDRQLWRLFDMPIVNIKHQFNYDLAGNIGAIHLRVDPEVGLQDFYFTTVQTLIVEFIKFSVLGLVFYLICVRCLSEPTNLLAEYLKQAMPGEKPLLMPLQQRKDEFGQLANSAFSYLMDNYKFSQRLGDAQSELQGVLDTVADAVVSIDDSGLVHFSNVSAGKLFRSSQLRGRAISSLIPITYELENTLDLFLALGGAAAKFSKKPVVICTRADATEFPAELTVGIYKSQDMAFIICTIKDMTAEQLADREKVELESRLNLSQKLEAVGQLAGGIAHDFNNILTIILGNAELAEMRLEQSQDAKLKKYVQVIDKSADRGVQLCKQLSVFSRGESISPQRIDINAHIRDMKDLIARLIRDDIRLEFELGEVSNILVDGGQFDQILLNLVKNAADAISGQGTIILTTCMAAADASGIPLSTAAGRTFVCVAVSDTGQGMTAETKQRLFEPFFTTKPVGEGTGLGLATVFGIVKKAGGQIDVVSEPDKGARFGVYFPACKRDWVEQNIVMGQAVNAELEMTILLCEDDANIRELAQTFLQAAGANVVTATNSRQAVALAKELDQLAILVTDVVMPEMNGKEVYEAISEFREVAVLYVSGYTADVIGHHGVSEKGKNFLTKPFTSEGLIQAVRSTLV